MYGWQKITLLRIWAQFGKVPMRELPLLNHEQCVNNYDYFRSLTWMSLYSCSLGRQQHETPETKTVYGTHYAFFVPQRSTWLTRKMLAWPHQPCLTVPVTFFFVTMHVRWWTAAASTQACNLFWKVWLVTQTSSSTSKVLEVMRLTKTTVKNTPRGWSFTWYRPWQGLRCCVKVHTVRYALYDRAYSTTWQQYETKKNTKS